MVVLLPSKAVECVWFLLMIVSSGHGTCNEGWSGPLCDMQCHCAVNFGCQINGRCQPNEPCINGYFGPSCQYLDLVFEEGSPRNPSYLTDNDDSTCNPDGGESSVTVLFKRKFRFTWLRVHISDGNLLLEGIHVRTNGMLDECPNIKWTKVNKIVDIVCDAQVLVENITIVEPLASRVCSVYFSGGRNLAIKQNVTMSSVGDSGSADFSVDGYKVRQPPANTTCSHSQVEQDSSVWNLSFRQVHLLYRVRIFNIADFQHRLARIKLTTFNSNMSVLEDYTGSDSVWELHVDFNMLSPEPVKYLSIKGGILPRVTDRVLSLCEVEIYGVTKCRNGFYGFACDKECTCKQYEVCFWLTGGCLSGCPQGRYGMDCDWECPRNCLGGSCESGTGACYKCPPGYAGKTCTDPCSKGTFGANCSQPCPARCSNQMCNHISGNCDRCATGRSGPVCDECRSGTFGNNCSQVCPPNCNGSKCDRISGNCLSCVQNYNELRCNGCVDEKYGPNCKLDCPVNCNKRQCNDVTGACVECAVGYQGAKCIASKTEEAESKLIWLFPLIALIPVIFGILAVAIKKDDKKRNKTLVEGSDKTKPSYSSEE